MSDYSLPWANRLSFPFSHIHSRLSFYCISSVTLLRFYIVIITFYQKYIK